MRFSEILHKFFSRFKKQESTVVEKAQTGFTTPDEYKDFKTKYLPYLAVFVLVAGLGVTLYQVRVMQDIRQHAQDSLTPPVTTPLTYSTTGGPAYKIADINHDHKVDIQDYNILVTQFYETGPSLSADFNNSGKVDIQDYNILVSTFGK